MSLNPIPHHKKLQFVSMLSMLWSSLVVVIVAIKRVLLEY